MNGAATALAVCCLLATALTPSPGTPRKGCNDAPLPATAATKTVRFQTVDIYVDTADKPLAAYQFTLKSAAGNAQLAGIIGSEHPAFAKPPYYDPKALIDERVVIAALSTDESLPRGRTRVARLTVQVSGGNDPRYELKLQAAAGPDGTPVLAKATVEATDR